MAYIYKIENDINGKLYIGKTEFSIEKRFKEHCSDAFRDCCEKRPLYAAMQKYGVEHFHISLIEETDEPEERERYWIEFFHSFKDGYNATLGGDGKRYLDYDLIIKTYQEVKNCNQTAKILNISSDSVRNVLHQNNISILKSFEAVKIATQKTVGMYDLQTKKLIKVFPSASDAARYLQDNSFTNAKALNGILAHIVNVCNKKRKSAYGFYWKYL